MANGPDKYARRRARTSNFAVILGISLVLFTLGVVAQMFLSSKELERGIKETIYIDINFKETAKEADIRQFEKVLKSQSYVRVARYINKEEAAKELDSLLNDDNWEGPIDGYNPILRHISLTFKEESANLETVKKIEEQLLMENQGIIESIDYDPNMFSEINNKFRVYAFVALAIALLLMVVSIALINNTIRLSIYSRRFIIRSMQLVGATERFIRRPFLLRSVVQGLIAGTVALGMFILGIYLLNKWIVEFKNIIVLKDLLIIFGGITLGGILISYISTYFALRKYLRIKTDNLY
jgi:cell division transport system permease protein